VNIFYKILINTINEMHEENTGPVLRKTEVQDDLEGSKLYVQLSKLPSFSNLREKVQVVVDGCSWWELYGKEWRDFLLGVPVFIIGILLIGQHSTLATIVGVLLIGCVHLMWSSRGGHLAAHGSLAKSKLANRFWTNVFVTFTGAFSTDVAIEAHIKSHHPHTNIIGLGDSAMWKAPMFGAHLYMYVMPLFLPPLHPIFSIGELIRTGRVISVPMLKYLVTAGLGYSFFTWILLTFTGLSLSWVFIITWIYRGLLSIPYIHVNIFQHIGLTMYSQNKRPTSRMYQMATGVLNLNSNPILDVLMGHSLISCHVEHHLFPNMSDNMCLKIKPVVKQFFFDNDLPYLEADYSERLRTFTTRYDEFMVKAPPITHFIGIQ